ncbi:MAG: glucose-1-phosphate adenylyltransferase [Anaerolineae bacterium]|nr:glucose-1-phosphate adenylyltransferase [Anaerolineae bacterium]
MRVLAVILAGGEGTRLSILSEKRAKPAVPFAGKYRIIDFVLSNCVNSDIYNVAVLTQYRPHSLNQHLGNGRPWDLDRTRGGLRLLQPYQGRTEGDWYRGTSDAVYQNLPFLDPTADTHLILGGDHIYKMDYRPMLAFHQANQADLTVGVLHVPMEETHRFGILTTDAEQRIIDFKEKPKQTTSTLASMGIYVFNADVLQRVLLGTNGSRPVDFGKDVVPGMIRTHRVFAYPFGGYWVDVGTVQSYWDANMDLLSPTPDLDLYTPDWTIHTRSEEQPPVRLGPDATLDRSLLSNGCVIEGRVEHSVLSPGVIVEKGAVVRDSILFSHTVVKAGAVVDRVISDKGAVIGENAVIGEGSLDVPNRQFPDRVNTGITLIGKNAHVAGGIHVGRNVLIRPDQRPSAFKGNVESGATV